MNPCLPPWKFVCGEIDEICCKLSRFFKKFRGIAANKPALWRLRYLRGGQALFAASWAAETLRGGSSLQAGERQAIGNPGIHRDGDGAVRRARKHIPVSRDRESRPRGPGSELSSQKLRSPSPWHFTSPSRAASLPAPSLYKEAALGSEGPVRFALERSRRMPSQAPRRTAAVRRDIGCRLDPTATASPVATSREAGRRARHRNKSAGLRSARSR